MLAVTEKLATLQGARELSHASQPPPPPEPTTMEMIGNFTELAYNTTMAYPNTLSGVGKMLCELTGACAAGQAAAAQTAGDVRNAID